MIHQLIYHSNSTTDITSTVLEKILGEAKKYNSEHGVTGCLLVSQKQYVHLLEGDQQIINEIFSKIKSNERNKDVSLIDNKMIERRLFPNSPIVYDVIGEADFEALGVGKQKDISFLRNDPETANKLFEHIKCQLDNESKKQGLGHNARLGPIV